MDMDDEEWQGEERRERKFHFEKSISLGHIITTISILVSTIWWASTVETRLAVDHNEIDGLKKVDSQVSDIIKTQQQEIRLSLNRLEDKMDRLQESRK